jgi:hypothetical protein
VPFDSRIQALSIPTQTLAIFVAAFLRELRTRHRAARFCRQGFSARLVLGNSCRVFVSTRQIPACSVSKLPDPVLVPSTPTISVANMVTEIIAPWIVVLLLGFVIIVALRPMHGD